MELNQQSENSQERERLQELSSYKILDSHPEISFDQLTLLAARACEAPIALLSFMDEKRQWFKSTVGMDIQEIPRHVTACNQIISSSQIYTIKDAAIDSCTYQEFMLKQGFKFYAGVPIFSKNGHAIGSICVIDTKSRELKPHQFETLKCISVQVTENLELRKRYQENLQRLRELDEVKSQTDKKMLDIAYRSSRKVVAELASGIDYRIRPFVSNILNATRILKSSLSTPEDLASLKSIKESGVSILFALNNLEKYVVAEKEKWMKPIDLNALIFEIITHLKRKLDEHNIVINLSLTEEVRCVGNYSKILESVYAVINNSIEAMQFAPGTIEVTMQTKSHFAEITIRDDGPGIDESIRQFIFHPFFTTKTFPSMGVGLALARHHIEEHGGTLELISSRSPTEFLIKLPVPWSG